MPRIALGVSYLGTLYQGWQSQPHGRTIQDLLERALSEIACHRVNTLCAGRTDSGVHALMQVVHFDTNASRANYSWLSGTNHLLPRDIAVQWARTVPDQFHARSQAISRRYTYVLLESIVRPSIGAGQVGWTHHTLTLEPMQQAAQLLLGEHDFSSFRAAACQSLSPIKHLLRLDIVRKGSIWRFDFQANAFLHHMIRNILGCLLQIGQGLHPPQWISEVLAARSRQAAAPTFMPDGLYFLGPIYEEHWQLPQSTPAFDALP